MPEITPNVIDRQWGPAIHQRYDALKHPVQDAGGNPCLILRHGGGWSSNDKRLPWIAGQRTNAIAWWLTDVKRGSTDAHWTVVSVGTRQAAWGTPNNTHSQNTTLGWYNEPPSRPTFFPDVIYDMQDAIRAVKADWRSLNIDPNRVVVGGTSAGAVNAMLSQVWAPRGETAKPKSQNVAQVRWDPPGFDSRCRGIFNFIGPPDLRLNGATESVTLSNWAPLFTLNTSAAAAAITTASREAASLLAYIERGETQYLPPMFSLYVGTPGSSKPYSDPHDAQQFVDLQNAYRKAGISNLHQGLLTPSWGDTDTGIRDSVNEQIYKWLNSVVENQSTMEKIGRG